MLKDQSELNSSRVPRRHSRKIPTPCESSSTGNDAHDWLGTAPLYPHQWKHASSRGYRHRRPPYGRAKAACHARHATFPFLSAPSSRRPLCADPHPHSSWGYVHRHLCVSPRTNAARSIQTFKRLTSTRHLAIIVIAKNGLSESTP